jgi:ABC-2 type transport system ATP-binding protein
MIQAVELSKKYSGKTVLNMQELIIPKGECFGLVGNNGAGKTTFFNLLLDLIKPSSGHIRSKEIRVDQSEDWKSYTAAYIDESFVIGYLTPEEYFNFLGNLRGISPSRVEEELEPFKALFGDEVLGLKKYIRDLSKGNQKKVGIAAAFLGSPEVVILDEPFANLDPTTQIRLKNYIKEVHLGGATTLLISSHDLTHITEVCERIVVLSKGDVVKDLKTSEETLKELETYFSV